jgi:rhamnulokinase
VSTLAGAAPLLPSARPAETRARVAIDLGAQSCRVSLLRWHDDQPEIQLIHRIPNEPVHENGTLRWPFDKILLGLEDGLRLAALAAPEGIASVAVDGWAVDYVRLGRDGVPIAHPFCYRDERTLRTKEAADLIAKPDWMFKQSGAQPLRINSVYQLLADHEGGIDPHAPWINLPEYVLYRLGGRRVAEYTNATHTAFVDLKTRDWSDEILRRVGLPRDAFPPIVHSGSVIGKLKGPLAELDAFRDTDLIVPACHDTASAVAGIPSTLEGTAYICSGTWSLVGTVIASPITTQEAKEAGFTNQGAAGGGYCFHTNVNGLWILQQCMEGWRKQGRPWDLPTLIERAAQCKQFPGIVPVEAPSLMLDDNLPARINEQLRLSGCDPIEDCAGNEPVFARTIFESLAARYASALQSLEHIVGIRLQRIHILGGGSLNQLLTRLTAERTGLPVEIGHVESSTIGNFAVQLAASERREGPLRMEIIRYWAKRLSKKNLPSEGRSAALLAK